MLLITSFCAVAASAADVWVVQGSAATPTGPCVGVVWQSELLLYNGAESPAEVRVVHQSNGGTANRTAVIPPRSSVSAGATALRSDSVAPLSVSHLQLPASVAIDSRLDLYGRDLCPIGRPPVPTPYGKIALPVFKSLTAAGEEQVHTGTDLALKPVRLNVAVYNAGNVEARAEIVLHWPFCNAAPDVVRVVTIPADTIVQVALDAQPPSCLANPFGPAWASFVSVVVDQPSLSLVSTLANGVAPDTNATIRAGTN